MALSQITQIITKLHSSWWVLLLILLAECVIKKSFVRLYTINIIKVETDNLAQFDLFSFIWKTILFVRFNKRMMNGIYDLKICGYLILDHLTSYIGSYKSQKSIIQ